MLKFDTPYFEATAHARFLYQSFSLEKANLSVLYKVIGQIDEFIASSPRIDKAHEFLYIYFFGPAATEFWIGREITGFIPKSISDFKVFDSYRGEAITWDMNLSQQGFDQWIVHAQQLRSLAGESLAMTWRVKVGPLEMFPATNPLECPNISFQFFKTD